MSIGSVYEQLSEVFWQTLVPWSFQELEYCGGRYKFSHYSCIFAFLFCQHKFSYLQFTQGSSLPLKHREDYCSSHPLPFIKPALDFHGVRRQSGLAKNEGAWQREGQGSLIRIEVQITQRAVMKTVILVLIDRHSRHLQFSHLSVTRRNSNFIGFNSNCHDRISF